MAEVSVEASTVEAVMEADSTGARHTTATVDITATVDNTEPTVAEPMAAIAAATTAIVVATTAAVEDGVIRVTGGDLVLDLDGRIGVGAIRTRTITVPGGMLPLLIITTRILTPTHALQVIPAPMAATHLRRMVRRTIILRRGIRIPTRMTKAILRLQIPAPRRRIMAPGELLRNRTTAIRRMLHRTTTQVARLSRLTIYP